MFKKIIILIMRCALSNNIHERIKYTVDATKMIKNLEQSINGLIDKTVKAGETITDQNDLLECFYAATGERSYDIVTTWRTLKKLKKKRLKERD